MAIIIVNQIAIKGAKATNPLNPFFLKEMIPNSNITKKNNPELIYLAGLTILAKEKLKIFSK